MSEHGTFGVILKIKITKNICIMIQGLLVNSTGTLLGYLTKSRQIKDHTRNFYFTFF